MALWDLAGKIEGKPCWQLIGGAANRVVTPYAPRCFPMATASSLTEAKRVAAPARDRGLPVVPHCWKSAIGIAASVHLAAVAPTCNFIEFLPRDLADSALRRELCRTELPVGNGRIPLPEVPGLGVELDEAGLARFAVARGATRGAVALALTRCRA